MKMKHLQAFVLAILLLPFTAYAVAPISVPAGGTGSSTLTGILKGNGTGGIRTAVPGTDFQAPITLTTTGSSGAASFIANILNIPEYASAFGQTWEIIGGNLSPTTTIQVALNSGLYLSAGDILFQGSNQHVISVGAMPDADTAGSALNLIAGQGNGIAGGGTAYLTGGQGGDTGTGGLGLLSGGNGGATSGDGGDAYIAGGTGTLGTGGNVILQPGNIAGAAGKVKFFDATTGFSALFGTAGMSADRLFTFPDKAGTFALTNDLFGQAWEFNSDGWLAPTTTPTKVQIPNKLAVGPTIGSLQNSGDISIVVQADNSNGNIVTVNAAGTKGVTLDNSGTYPTIHSDYLTGSDPTLHLSTYTNKSNTNGSLFITSAGNVGIGTAAPPDLFSLVSGNANTNFSVKNSSGTGYFGVDGTKTFIEVMPGGSFGVNNSAGVSKLTVDEATGNTSLGTTPTANRLEVNGTTESTQLVGTNYIDLVVGGANRIYMSTGGGLNNTGGVMLINGEGFQFSDGDAAGGTLYSSFTRDATNYIALTGGTRAQTLRVNNTYTDALNYERGVFDWATHTNILTIGTENGGTGSARGIDFITASTTRVSISSTGAFSLATTTAGCAQFSGAGELFSTGSVCGSGGGGTGTVTNIATTYPLLGGPITTTGTLSLAFGTTTSNTWAGTQTFTNPIVNGTLSGLIAGNAGITYAASATTTHAFSGPFTVTGTIGNLVGGTDSTITWNGLATTSQPSSSNVLTSNGGAGVYGTATSTLTATGPLTGSFTQLGSGGTLGCITASAGVSGCLSGTDWSTFNNKLSSAVQTLVLPQGSFSGNITIATTSNTTNGITSTLTAVGSGSTVTFSSNQSGTLTVPGGGTGTTTGGVIGGVYYWNNSTYTNGSGFYYDGVSKVGIGSTTPWAQLAIASSTYNYANPLVSVATSSDSFGHLFSIFATSSVLATNANTIESGVRIAIGIITGVAQDSVYALSGILDQLYINGRVNTGDWHTSECSSMSSAIVTGTQTSDFSNVCSGWQFQIDGNGIFNQNLNGSTHGAANNAVNGLTNIGLAVSGGISGINPADLAGANFGAGLFAGSTANGLIFATSTPTIEVVGKILYPGNATSSAYYIGFSNLNISGTAFEVEPTVGCYFVASSTEANWKALCRTSSSNVTIVDTGFASTTLQANGGGSWYRFRIDIDKTAATFRMASSSKSFVNVATISTNFPAGTSGNGFPGIWLANGPTGGLTKAFVVNYARLWWRTPSFNYAF